MTPVKTVSERGGEHAVNNEVAKLSSEARVLEWLAKNSREDNNGSVDGRRRYWCRGVFCERSNDGAAMDAECIPQEIFDEGACGRLR